MTGESSVFLIFFTEVAVEEQGLTVYNKTITFLLEEDTKNNESEKKMKAYKLECENCGATLEIKAKSRIYKCEYCDSVLQMPKVMYDELNKVEELQKDQEKRTVQNERDEVGLEEFTKQKKFWSASWIVLLIVTLALIGMENSTGSEYLRSYYPSLLIFGLCYVFPSKPKNSAYLGFRDGELQKACYKEYDLWRKVYAVWTVIMSICWGFPNFSPMHDMMFNLGMVLLIGGIILLVKFSPSRYRKSREGEKIRR